MFLINNKFKIGQVVYLLSDEEQLKRVVTGICVYSGNYYEYRLSQGTHVSWHADIEITKEKTLQL